VNVVDRELDFVRAELARVGIVLDDPRDAIAHRDVKPDRVAPVDRDALRAELVTAGALDRELDWLTASFPSVEKARAYHPAHIAWCPCCDGPTVCDDHGCIACRTGGEP
jgi:hypothetical protein